jgi:hypothetical protein
MALNDEVRVLGALAFGAATFLGMMKQNNNFQSSVFLYIKKERERERFFFQHFMIF